MLQFFLEGGAGMLPTAVLGVAALVLSSVYAARPRSRLVPLIASTGAASLLAGALGMFIGVQTTIAAVTGPSAPLPDRVPMIALAGVSESANNMVLALALVTLAALALGVGGFRSAGALRA